MNSKLEEDLFGVLLLTIIVVLGGFGVYALFKTITSTGKIDHCYVDSISGMTGGYEVVGHRSWRQDAHLGVANSAEDANIILLNSVVCSSVE